MGRLKDLGIIQKKFSVAEAHFEKLFPNFLEVDYSVPHEYVQKYWEEYKSSGFQSKVLNGKIFEIILATLCVREGILPIYLNAKVAFVPNVKYDLMFYTNETGPICWSAKTSLRERYKQADLEAIALKYVHRKSICNLITLDPEEARIVKLKILSGDVLGINKVILANTVEFDECIDELKKYTFSEPPFVRVFTSKQIITQEKVSKIRTSFSSG